MSDVKWIKIVTDIFDDEKIMLIEAMPEPDGIIVIWFKILCLAGKQNNGGVLTLNGRMPYTDEMLATIFRRLVTMVRMALNAFQSLGMIEIVSGAVTIPNWGKHQNLEGIQKRREYMSGYMRDYREKQKLLAESTSSKCLRKPNVSDTELDRDRDVDRDKELDKENNDNMSGENKKINKAAEDIIDECVIYLNSVSGRNFKPKTESIRKFIRARISEGYVLDDFKRVIDNQWFKWKDTDMAEYMRPSTLFSAEKFPNYINAPDYSKQAVPKYQNKAGRFEQIDFDKIEV